MNGQMLHVKMYSDFFAFPVDVPRNDFWKNPFFRAQAGKCAKRKTGAMNEMAMFFDDKMENAVGEDREFFRHAAFFWRSRALRYADESAEVIREKCVAMISDDLRLTPFLLGNMRGFADGRTLNALGFGFFSEGKVYSLCGINSGGVVSVMAFAGDEGPDADGFGREQYYDWWYLDDCLNLPSDAEGIYRYSFSDRQNAQEKFRRQCETVKAVSRMPVMLKFRPIR